MEKEEIVISWEQVFCTPNAASAVKRVDFVSDRKYLSSEGTLV
jgi:hypothetical protein